MLEEVFCIICDASTSWVDAILSFISLFFSSNH